MPRGRPRLPLGTHGKISVVHVGESRYKAQVNYRAHDGKLRVMARFGDTKGRAEAKLKAALSEWLAGGGQVIGPDELIRTLAQQWLWGVEQSDRSIRTKEQYRFGLRRYVLPRIGELRASEATPAVVDRTLKDITARHGPSSARLARAVMNGILGLAVRRGSLPTNPMREAERLSVGRRKQPRALTREEATDLVDKLRADPRATLLDLPDLVEFMLATGCRVGEALAVRDSVLDLEVGTVEVNATIVRVTGQGLVVQERPKTAAGWRVLALPPFVVDMVRRRDSEVRFEAPQGVVFGSPFRASLRDPSNLSGDFRAAFDRAGYPWMTSHSLRKSVATWLDEAGWSARQIADQLGHAQPSLTLNTYMGRRVVSAEAAEVLDR